MHITRAGEGPSVLLLHGGGVAGWMWRGVQQHLGEGVATIVPDLPGSGRSAASSYLSHEATVDALAAQLGDEPVTVAGFSLGAQLAMLLAVRHPQLVKGLVVVSAETKPAPLPGPTLALLGWAAPLARLDWFARLQARELGIPDDLLDGYLGESAELTRETLLAQVGANLRFTLPDAWGTVGVPVTFLVGGRERRLMLDSARAAHEALPGSTLHVVEGAGHDLPFSRSELVADAVRGFL